MIGSMRFTLVFGGSLLLFGAFAVDQRDFNPIRSYPKGTQRLYDIRIEVQDLLERDLNSTGDWKPWRDRRLQLGFELAVQFTGTGREGAVTLDATIRNLKGNWVDRSPEDDKRPEIEAAFVPPEAPPKKEVRPAKWEDLSAAWAGPVHGADHYSAWRLKGSPRRPEAFWAVA